MPHFLNPRCFVQKTFLRHCLYSYGLHRYDRAVEWALVVANEFLTGGCFRCQEEHDMCLKIISLASDFEHVKALHASATLWEHGTDEGDAEEARCI